MDDLQLYVLLTVFQSYQDDGRVIMKGYVQWKLVYSWKEFFLQQGLSQNC